MGNPNATAPTPIVLHPRTRHGAAPAGPESPGGHGVRGADGGVDGGVDGPWTRHALAERLAQSAQKPLRQVRGIRRGLPRRGRTGRRTRRRSRRLAAAIAEAAPTPLFHPTRCGQARPAPLGPSVRVGALGGLGPGTSARLREAWAADLEGRRLTSSDGRPHLAWGCTHVEGDRSVANVGVAPDGVYYDNLDAPRRSRWSRGIWRTASTRTTCAGTPTSPLLSRPPCQPSCPPSCARTGPSGRHDYVVSGRLRKRCLVPCIPQVPLGHLFWIIQSCVTSPLRTGEA